MSNLIVINSPDEVESLIEYIKDFDYVALDIETTGLDRESEIIGYSICTEDDNAFYVVLAAWNKEKQALDYFPQTKQVSINLLESLKSKNLICHNAIFDISMIEAYFKVSLIDSLHTDTLLLAHIVDENRPKGLKELAKIYFGMDSNKETIEMKASVAENGGLLTKANYEMFKADSQLLGKYGAQDALLTFKLFNQLVPILFDEGLDEFFYDQETMPLLKTVTYQLNTVGLQVDTKALTSLQKQLEAECEELKSYIYQEINIYIKDKYPGKTKKDMFNIGSSSQLAWLVFGELNLEFGTLTKEGKNVCKFLLGKLPYKPSDKNQFIIQCRQSKDVIYDNEGKKPKKIKDPWGYIACDKTILAKFAPKYKWIAKLLEYQKKQKLLNTYVLGMGEKVKYGILQPRFNQAGTTSGRYSSSDPNLQNLPRDDKRIKQTMIARPGKVFVGADYSQLEPRVFSYVSQDTNLITAFNGTNDFYSVIGMKVYGKTDCTPQKEGSEDAFGIKYKKLRDLSKVIALASVYGATANQLASTTGKSIEDTQEDIDAYFAEFPGVAKLMLDSHQMAITKGYVENIFGRKRRMPEAMKIGRIYGKTVHKELPYEARSLLNLSTNHRIQSTAASIVNRASIQFLKDCKQAGIEAKIVVQVHDSLVTECKEEDAENVSLLLQNAMENTTILPGVPLEAVPKIGINLAEV
jgi:DNA polymerase-1